MKKIAEFKITLIIGLLLCAGFATQAQVHVELGSSFQSPLGDFAKTYDPGVGFSIEPRVVLVSFSIEPRVVLSDKLAVGLYVGFLGFGGADLSGQTNANLANLSIDAAIIVPVIGTATYKILDSKVIPYVGGGFGMYSIESTKFDFNINNPSAATVKRSEFGFMGRGGIFLGRVNLGVSYHNAADLNFLQFSLGVRIGPW